MGLVNLYDAPQSDVQWRDMWWNNWNAHQDIVKAIQTQLKIPLTLYMMWPWTESNLDQILQQHQYFHTDMLSATGIAQGNDLSVLDINDPKSVEGWIYEHFQEHLAVNTALKL